MGAGPMAGPTATISVPGGGTASAAEPIFVVMAWVVFGLMTLIRIEALLTPVSCNRRNTGYDTVRPRSANWKLPNVCRVIAQIALFLGGAIRFSGSDRPSRSSWQMARHLRYRLVAGAGNRSIEWRRRTMLS